MIQLYFLSIIYLLIGAAIILSDFYRRELSFILRFRHLLEERRAALDIFFYSGLVIALLCMFFPLSPGPIIIGDLIPSLAIMFLAFFVRYAYSDKNRDSGINLSLSYGRKKRAAGFTLVIIASLHFIFPTFVLI